MSQRERGDRQESVRTEYDVIVVGGGLAGLTAGATAAAGGASAVVLEAHQPGGRARTVQREGFTLNMGAHAFYRGGSGRRVLASLGITPAGGPPPLSAYRALYEGHQHLLPTGPGSLVRTSLLGVKGKVQFGRLLTRVGRIDPASLAGISVRQWLDDQELRPEVDAVVRALVRLSTYTADVERFSAGAALGQVQMAAKGGVLYLHGGWSQLIEALGARVDVRVGAPVRSIEPVAGGVEVRTEDTRLVAGHVVVAVGPPAATAGLVPGLPGPGELGEPVTAACLDVGVRRPPPQRYILGVDEPLYATTQSPPARQAPPGAAVLAVIRYGARRAELDRPQLVEHLRAMGVDDDDVTVDRFLASMVVTGAMPRADRGGMAGRPGIDAGGMPGVSIAGDWVGPEGLLADGALASGQAAGRRALASLGRSAVVHSAPE